MTDNDSLRETGSVLMANSCGIYYHASGPEEGMRRNPGWHVWEVTQTRRPAVLCGGEWDRLVAQVDGDVTQTRGWAEYALETDDERAILIAGIDEDGIPRAVVTGYIARSRLSALGFRTVRFPAYPSAAQDIRLVTAAVQACERVARAHRCMSITFMGGGQPKAIASLRIAGYHVHEQLEYVLDLTGGRDWLWAHLHPDQRRSVRYSERMNVKVVRMESVEAVRALRDLQLEVNRRHAEKGDLYGLRSPSAYESLHRTLIVEGLARLYCAIVDDSIVMAALCSTYGKRARGIYNGASRRGLELRATSAAIWHMMSQLSLEGYEQFSLGMAGPDVGDPSSTAHGLHRFKLTLGAEVRHIPFAVKELKPPLVLASRMLKRARSLASIHG